MSEIEDNREVPDELLRESIAERIWGLTEMFPESVQRATSTISTCTINGVKWSWNFTRKSLWILSTSFAIGILPLVVVHQRLAFEDMMNEQRKQGLFGPGIQTDSKQQDPL